MEKYGLLVNSLKQKKIPHKTEQLLTKYCSFKIGGLSPLVIETSNIEELSGTIPILEKLGVPYKLLGGGTNVLISDNPDDFVVLRLSGNFKEFKQLSEFVFYIGAAANTTPTFRNISLMGYTGLEFLSTIPGTVGGAVIQNAGCYGGEFFDFIEFVDILQNNQVRRLYKKEIDFGYRRTQFLENKDSIILGIQIQTKRGDLKDIENSLKEKREKRKASQPENRKSAGSIFKNPKNSNNGQLLKSWQLIDKVGLRGHQKGDAEISQKHCNFIVNNGKAKASDVYYLINLVQEKVWQNFGIKLEREVEFFGTIN